MKVLLLFPNSPIRSDPCCCGYEPVKLVPHEMLICAASLRNNYDVKVLDAKVEGLSLDRVKKQILDFKPDVVCLWTTQMSYLKDIKILDFVKKNGMKTVFVMNEPLLLDYVMKKFDFLDFTIHRWREFVLKELLDNIKTPEKVKGIVFRKGNKVVDNGLVEFFDFSKAPLPAYDMVPMEKYAKDFIAIYTSRNCPYKCTFCFWGNSKWSPRTVEQMIEETEILIKKYGYTQIGFIDQTFTVSRERIVGFCKEILKRRLKFEWIFSTTVGLVDYKLLKLMRKAGCTRIFYGVEHINEQVLKNVKKYQTKEQIIKAIKLSKKAGIRAVIPFIIGLPGETKESLKEIGRFILKAKPWSYHIILPIAFPGTPLYEQAKKEGWLLVEEKPENFWTTFDLTNPVMAVPPFTPEELVAARKKLQIIPRLHPVMLVNTLRDVYSRGGMTKIKQVFEGALRIVFNKPRKCNS